MTQCVEKDQLLAELVELAREGPIRPATQASNAVGKTLQRHLGIEHRTTAKNSKHGFTITGTSTGRGSGGRTNLFACVPNWRESNVKSSGELAELTGEPNLEKQYSASLFCTVSALLPNRFGLSLLAMTDPPSLHERWLCNEKERTLLSWDMDRLFSKLLALGNTAVVVADKLKSGAGEVRFQFTRVEFLGPPDPQMFLQLIDEGAITVDHLISRREGQTSAVEKGPLFKIRADARDELYTSVEKHELLSL